MHDGINFRVVSQRVKHCSVITPDIHLFKCYNKMPGVEVESSQVVRSCPEFTSESLYVDLPVKLQNAK